MIQRHDYKGKCWWCTNTADSREHRFKKADIIREFGKGPFKKGHVVKTDDGFDEKKGLPIQGPNSNYLKFSKNICQKCNNERSQPFDLAYDKFMDHLKANEDTIFDSKVINLQSVFGISWNTDYENLVRYFVKNISTRFADLGIKIEPEIIKYLNGNKKLKFLDLSFQIRTDWAEVYKLLKETNKGFSYIHASGVEGRQSKSLGSYYFLGGTLQYRWFEVKYNYDSRTAIRTNKKLNTEMFKLVDAYKTSPDDIKKMIKEAKNKKNK